MSKEKTINKNKLNTPSSFRGWTVLVMDRSHGIDRPLIGEGKFSLGVIGGRVYLEYLFESLRAIEKAVDVPFRIVVPYAHGLDKASPRYAIRDFFYYMTTPCQAGWYKRNATFDCAARKLLEETASRCQVELIPIAEETGVYDWCRAHLHEEDRVMWINSSQIALNLPATTSLIQRFLKADVMSMCAKGHSVGLTPVLYRSQAWMNMLSAWKPEQGAHNPHPVTQVDLDPVLNALEDHKARIVFRTGHDTRNAILIKENQDLFDKSLIDVAKCYIALMEKKEFTASSGRTFTILFGEGLRYYGSGEGKAPTTFDQAWNVFLAERKLLNQHAGVDFAGRDVLEIGCGDGSKSLFIKRTGAKNVVATDLEIGIGAPGQRRLLAQWPTGDENPLVFDLEGEYPSFDTRGLSFLETPAEALPFPDHSFDIVYSNQVLEHVRDPFQCLKEMMRMLRSGGVLLLRYNSYFHLIGGHGECSTDVPWSHVIMTPDEMEEYLAYTEFPERGKEARKSLECYFNPVRLTIAQFEKYIERMMPAQILFYHPQIQTHLSENITPELIHMAKKNYPEITLRDFLVGQVTIIVRRL